MDNQDILERSDISDPRHYIGKIHKIIRNYDIEDEEDIPILTKKINSFINKNPAINSIETTIRAI